eukprot:13052790-Alexandrium_andersonii.AAC.1
MPGASSHFTYGALRIVADCGPGPLPPRARTTTALNNSVVELEKGRGCDAQQAGRAKRPCPALGIGE